MKSIKTLIPAEDVLTTEMEDVLGGIHIIVKVCKDGDDKETGFPNIPFLFLKFLYKTF